MVTIECFEYFDLPFDLTLLDWFEGLDDDSLIILSGDASVDFRIFSLAYLGDDFELIDIAAFMAAYPYSIS